MSGAWTISNQERAFNLSKELDLKVARFLIPWSINVGESADFRGVTKGGRHKEFNQFFLYLATFWSLFQALMSHFRRFFAFFVAFWPKSFCQTPPLLVVHKRVVLADVQRVQKTERRTPKTGTRAQKFKRTTAPKAGTRAHSPKPPF